MSEQQGMNPPRGRTIAFRIVAGLFAAVTIVSTILFTIPVFTETEDKIQAFHDLGSFPAFVFLLGFSLMVLTLRPTDVVALRISWATTIATVIASVIGQDFVSGSYFIAPVVLIVLTVLSPTRDELFRFGSPNVALLSLAVIAAIPAYPSSIGSRWGVLALFVGLVYIVVAEATGRSAAAGAA